MAQAMGLGRIGGPNIIFKRKYRWTFEVNTCAAGLGTIPAYQVKLASRPNLSIEETEINFLHGKMWIPGKGSWETITVTYYDLADPTEDTGIRNLYSWLASVYDFTDPVNLYQSSRRGDIGGAITVGYAGVGTLKLFDGCGVSLETWTLKNLWPQAINFGELDYSSSEEVTIEVTLRYSEVEYEINCGAPFEPCPCVGCG
jgi:hypothetical protein